MSVSEVSVCIIVGSDDDRLDDALSALSAQTVPHSQYEIVVIDASAKHISEHVEVPAALDVKTVVLHPSTSHGARLNQAWRLASRPGIAFVSPNVRVGEGWVEAIGAALSRGRRIVDGRWLASDRSLPDAGAASYRLWAQAYEAPLVTTAQLAVRRSDIEDIGGFDETVADVDEGDALLAARLVESGVDRHWARDALVFVDLDAAKSLTEMAAERFRVLAARRVLADRPRARARLLTGGVFGQRRTAEAALLLAGVVLARRDLRFLALGAPWVHERTCLTPTGGGSRRRVVTLPGVLAFDLFDLALPLLARLRARR